MNHVKTKIVSGAVALMFATLAGCSVAAEGLDTADENVGVTTQASTSVTPMSECWDLVGGTRVPVSRVRHLVPSRYTLAESAGEVELITITVACASLTVGTDTRATALTVVGVMIQSPDGTGAHNVYSLAFNSDNPKLVNLMKTVGVTTTQVNDEHYVTTAQSATSYSSRCGAPYTSPFSMRSTGTPPSLRDHSQSNWWEDNGSVTVKYRFNPNMDVGLCSGELQFDTATSQLAQIVGKQKTAMTGRCFHIHALENTMTVETIQR